MQSVGLRQQLKEATASKHEQLERDVAAMGFFSSLSAYCQYLQRLLPLHFNAEQLLNDYGARTVIPDWPQRLKAQALLTDLASVAGVLEPPHTMEMPGPARADRWKHPVVEVSHNSAMLARLAGRGSASTLLPAKITRPEHVLGIAYVIEGSTLGGARLLQLAAVWGITPERGGSFLASYGSARGRMWNAFVATLERWNKPPLDCKLVVEYALRTFDATRVYLTGEPGLVELPVDERRPAATTS